MRKIVAVLLAALMPTFAVAQSANQFPSTMPSGTVYGRLAIGAGPGQPVPITSLLSAAQQSAANKVLAGPTSGGTGAMTARSLLYADFPSMAAGTLLGNPGSAPAVPQAFTIQNLPNLTAPNATLDFLPIYDHTTGQIKYSSPSQLPGQTSPLANNNTWTGTNDFQGATRFGGLPWFDAKSSAHGCAAAVGDNSTDDTAAIQCHINYLNTTFGGGEVFFPPGNYLVSAGGLNVKAGIWLKASCIDCASIQVHTDSAALQAFISGGTCPSGGLNGGIDKISIYGYQNAAATQGAIIVGASCLFNIYHSRVWFGSTGLNTAGSDGHITDSFICGYQTCIQSTGANWYYQAKLDAVIPGTVPTLASFAQNANAAGLTIAENHFVSSDFSCGCSHSMIIADTANTSVTGFLNSVFDSPITITNARWVQISNSEVGSSIAIAAGTLMMATTGAFTSTSVSGAGGRSCAANVNITC